MKGDRVTLQDLGDYKLAPESVGNNVTCDGSTWERDEGAVGVKMGSKIVINYSLKLKSWAYHPILIGLILGDTLYTLPS